MRGSGVACLKCGRQLVCRECMHWEIGVLLRVPALRPSGGTDNKAIGPRPTRQGKLPRCRVGVHLPPPGGEIRLASGGHFGYRRELMSGGRERMGRFVDPGASTSVVPREVAIGYPLKQGSVQRSYTTASKTTVPSDGDQILFVVS